MRIKPPQSGPCVYSLFNVVWQACRSQYSVEITINSPISLCVVFACQDVAWRASLTTLLLPPCGSPRISHTAQVFCSTLASVLSRLPNLHTLAAPTVDNATTVAFITARAGGGLRRLHTLRFKDSFKDSAQVWLSGERSGCHFGKLSCYHILLTWYELFCVKRVEACGLSVV
jgi:hypothetical protein